MEEHNVDDAVDPMVARLVLSARQKKLSGEEYNAEIAGEIGCGF